MKLLVTAPIMIKHLVHYKEQAQRDGIELVTPAFDFGERLDEKQLLAALVGMDGILCGDDEINRTVISNFRDLKVISKWGTGVDSIDCDYAEQQGIPVHRVKDVFSHPVSDSIMGYILMICRSLVEKNHIVKSGSWDKLPGFCLHEKTLGVIGGGAIGSCLIKKALAFDMTVYLSDIEEKDLSVYDSDRIKQVSFDELLMKSDFISLNCDCNVSSYQLLSASSFVKMKKTARVINTARGGLIDQDSLIVALKSNQIAGAFLDVFSVEPLPLDSPLRSIESVWFSPHNTNASEHVEHLVCKRSLSSAMSEMISHETAAT